MVIKWEDIMKATKELDLYRKKVLLEELREKIFNNLKGKQRLEVKKIKEYLKDLSIKVDIPIDNSEQLKQYFLNSKVDESTLKDLMRKCFNEAGINFDTVEFDKILDRKMCWNIFDSIFNIYPIINSKVSDRKMKTEEVNNKEQEILEKSKIQNINSISIKNLQEIYDKANKICIEEKLDICEFNLTETMPVTIQDDFYMVVNDENLSINTNCVGLVDCNENKVVAVGYLKAIDEKYYLIFAENNINYNSFEENSSFKVIVFPTEVDLSLANGNITLYEKECSVYYKKLEDTNNALCIDFGTSNTTAGSYKVLNPNADYEHSVELVKFVDVTDKSIEKEIFPTIVYVKSCENEKVEYLFGYEARKKIIDNDYDTKASVFYEIKRWINDIDEVEEIFDEKGKKREISRREILKAYIQHVIALSERYFKKHFKRIHFSAPIKLKEIFINEMKDLFKDKYEIIEACSSLDEGIAIIYNHVADNMKKNNSKHEKIMILDCGGGTTDLASCEYEYDLSGYNKKIEIKTRFENGNFNFGGNNITYRILQLLKIKLANHLRGNNNNKDLIKTLLKDDENDILSQVDEAIRNNKLIDVKKDIYKDFDLAYQDAEKYIPTRFTECKLMNEKRKYKRNYYYLWQMAEAIKVEFHRINDLVAIDFNKEEDRYIYAKNVEQYYLYVNNGQKLEQYNNPMKDIEITIKEVRMVLFSDIYILLSSLLKDYSGVEDKKLLEYNKYKLSGQSCKINLFHELLKEFIPGKRIRYKGKSSNDSSRLKMACICGCIEYIRDKESGYIDPNIDIDDPKMIYNVYHIKQNGEELVLGMNKCDIVVSSQKGKHLEFIVRDNNDIEQKRFTYDFVNGYKMNKCIQIDELISMMSQNTYMSEINIEKSIKEKLESIEANDRPIVVCVLPSKIKYGMIIYQILVDEKGYYIQENNRFECFESLETFFDGMR